MKSTRPKPLHHLCGRPMVLYVLDAAAQEDVRATVVVVGHGATWVEKSLTERARADVNLMFVEQSEQLGTGHAVSVATILDRLVALAELPVKARQDPALLRPVDIPILVGNGARLATLTGWKPEIALDDTLADVLRAWREA